MQGVMWGNHDNLTAVLLTRRCRACRPPFFCRCCHFAGCKSNQGCKDKGTFVNSCTNNYFRCNNICKCIRPGRGALPPDSPTSPRTPRREGEAWGGGLCVRCGSPAPCLPCGDGDGSLPPACAVPQCARCRRVRRVRALWGCALAGAGWRRRRSGQAGGLGWSAHAPPAPCFPLPAPLRPTDGGRGAERAPPWPRPGLLKLMYISALRLGCFSILRLQGFFLTVFEIFKV